MLVIPADPPISLALTTPLTSTLTVASVVPAPPPPSSYSSAELLTVSSSSHPALNLLTSPLLLDNNQLLTRVTSTTFLLRTPIGPIKNSTSAADLFASIALLCKPSTPLLPVPQTKDLSFTLDALQTLRAQIQLRLDYFLDHEGKHIREPPAEDEKKKLVKKKKRKVAPDHAILQLTSLALIILTSPSLTDTPTPPELLTSLFGTDFPLRAARCPPYAYLVAEVADEFSIDFDRDEETEEAETGEAEKDAVQAAVQDAMPPPPPRPPGVLTQTYNAVPAAVVTTLPSPSAGGGKPITPKANSLLGNASKRKIVGGHLSNKSRMGGGSVMHVAKKKSPSVAASAAAPKRQTTVKAKNSAKNVSFSDGSRGRRGEGRVVPESPAKIIAETPQKPKKHARRT